MAKILVTGASGFIGSRLVSALTQAGESVRCLVRGTSRREVLVGCDVEFVEGDLTPPAGLENAVRGVDVVYHLGGATLALSRQVFDAVNRQGAIDLANACAAQPNPPLFVFVSSLAAAGPSPWGQPRREEDPPAPVSNYGKSKRGAEENLEKIADRLPITVLRPPIVFGSGDQHTFKMFQTVRMGVQVAPGLRRTQYSLVHVEDLVAALRAAADRGKRLVVPSDPRASDRPGYYFTAYDERPTYGELGRLMREAMGRRRLIVARAPYFAMWAYAALVEAVARIEGKQRLLNFDKMREATAGSWTCTTVRAREELGFTPSRVLLDRLRETVQGYVEKGWLRA